MSEQVQAASTGPNDWDWWWSAWRDRIRCECRLTDPKCSGTFGDNGLGVLEDTDYRVVGFGSDRKGQGAATISSESVFINSQGAFFSTPSAEGQVTLNIPGAQITFLSQASADAFLLLHELGHQTGVFTADAGFRGADQVNAENSWQVLTNCFGIDKPGGKP